MDHAKAMTSACANQVGPAEIAVKGNVIPDVRLTESAPTGHAYAPMDGTVVTAVWKDVPESAMDTVNARLTK